MKIKKTWTVLLIAMFSGCAQKVFANDGKSQKRIFQCCARHEKMIKVGRGITGEMIEFDIGQCRKLCPKNVFFDPGDQSKPAVQKCTQTKHCRPRSSKIERVSTIEGVKQLENIETCECSAPQYCKRKRYNHLLYGGTPYQTNIDVGLCMGYCGRELGCKPVKNRTVSIKGPNGNELYQTVEKCGCTHSCYRMDHVETILDYNRVKMSDGNNSYEIRPFVKQINVGKCVGNCDDMQTETCLIWDRRSPFKCFSTNFAQANCAPVLFRVQEYRNRRGFQREIIQIIECSCV